MKQELINYANGIGCKDDVFDWMDKMIFKKDFRSKDGSINTQSVIEYVLDYLASDKRPKRLERATFDQMRSNTEKWVNSLQKKGNKIEESEGEDFETVLDFKDGFKFVKLISKNSYDREGSLMRHCVSSYFGRDVEIFSLRDSKNNPHCTIEKDIQIKGKGNGCIDPRYIDYVVRFLEFTGMKVRDSEMSNLGYKVAIFLEYIDKEKTTLYRDKYVYKERDVFYIESVKIFDSIEKAVSYDGKNICLYSGDADFEGSKITDLGQLQQIGGYAYFRNSNVTHLGQLQQIGGDADFEGSKITDLGQLQQIGGYADFEGSKITQIEIEKFRERSRQY